MKSHNPRIACSYRDLTALFFSTQVYQFKRNRWKVLKTTSTEHCTVFALSSLKYG